VKRKLTKYIAIAAGLLGVACIALFGMLIKASQAKAVAESANASLAVQIHSQEKQIRLAKAEFESELQEISRVEGDRRLALRAELLEAESNLEGAAALMNDEDWYCASELVPAVYIDGMRSDNENNRGN
jgi:Tfp pilus assembly protein PilN